MVPPEPPAQPALETEELLARAKKLGISAEALELCRTSDVIDLHVDSFIWTRVFGYDLRHRHGAGLLGARYFSQVDFPRAREGCLSGALWSITTNPFRTAAGRVRALAQNLASLRAICRAANEQVALVATPSDYRAARASGRHAVIPTIQGGNALDRDAAAVDLLADGPVAAVTLMHLSNSRLGATSAALWNRDSELTPQGRAYIERLNELRVFVDLAHINRRGFFAALEVHDRALPPLVSHTGLSALCPSWRNIDDEQLRAVADRGGVVGVIFHGGYLGGGYFNGGSAELIVDHIAHIVNTVGEDHAAIGSDWDGAIITPRDMPTCVELPRLVQRMLNRGFSPQRIQKVLGGNFLRAWELLRA